MLFTSKFKFKKRELTDSPPDITATNDNWDTVEKEFIRQETEIKTVKEQVENIDVSWEGITGKPSTFPPATHTHDDRYYTESEIDTKLNGKANSSHTHTKSQITDFPTSLPANGGNADTVDGKHASEFALLNALSSGRMYVSNPNSASSDFGGSAIEIREMQQVGNTKTSREYAPAIGYHWSNVSAGTIAMHSDGHFHFRAQGHSESNKAYRNVVANDYVLPDGTSLKSIASQSPIKSIQRGVYVGNWKENATISISAIDPSKSMVILNGSQADAYDQYSYLHVLVSLSSTSLVVSRSGFASTAAQFSWQVIEFK